MFVGLKKRAELGEDIAIFGLVYMVTYGLVQWSSGQVLLPSWCNLSPINCSIFRKGFELWPWFSLLSRLAVTPSGVCVAEKTVGGWTDFRLVDGMSSISQGLWTIARKLRSVDLSCNDSDHGQALGVKSHPLSLLKHPLSVSLHRSVSFAIVVVIAHITAEAIVSTIYPNYWRSNQVTKSAFVVKSNKARANSSS